MCYLCQHNPRARTEAIESILQTHEDAESRAKAIFNSAEQKDSLKHEVLALLLLKERYSVEGVWKNLWRLQDMHREEEGRKRTEAHQNRMRDADERMRQLDLEIQNVGKERDAIKEEGILFSHD